MRFSRASVLLFLLTSTTALISSGSFALADGLQPTSGHRKQVHHTPTTTLRHNNPAPHAHHPIRIQQLFVVTERNPLTGEVVAMPRRFSSRLEATQYRESLRNGAWVIWRYIGVNEPLRSMRFSNRLEAEDFLLTGGPARRGIFGMVLLTSETRILPARVSLETVYVR